MGSGLTTTDRKMTDVRTDAMHSGLDWLQLSLGYLQEGERPIGGQHHDRGGPFGNPDIQRSTATDLYDALLLRKNILY